jgi:hypothetical protein
VLPGYSNNDQSTDNPTTMGIQMAKTERTLIALLALSCSQEFTSATHNFNDSSSRSPIHVSDAGIDRMARDTAVPVRFKETGPTADVDATYQDTAVPSIPDSTPDAAPSTPDDAAEPHPKDAAREAALQEAGPAYCVDCPPVFGRPACCNAYKRCGYLNGLNVCTGPTH